MNIDSYFVYIILRSEFLRENQHIYKIGCTKDNPPHLKLWKYPYGSLFIALYKVKSCDQIEKLFSDILKNTSNIKWRKDIGDEYFEGNLQLILNVFSQLYSSYKPSDVIIIKDDQYVNGHYLQLINGIKYLPFHQANKKFYNEIRKCQLPMTNIQISQKDIYNAYNWKIETDKIIVEKTGKNNTNKYPDNYIAKPNMSLVQSHCDPIYKPYKSLVKSEPITNCQPLMDKDKEEYIPKLPDEIIYNYTMDDILKNPKLRDTCIAQLTKPPAKKMHKIGSEPKILTIDDKTYALDELLQNDELRKQYLAKVKEKNKKKHSWPPTKKNSSH